MNVLLDVNVILDVLLLRQPWVVESQAVWDACDNGRLGGYVAAFGLPTIFYIVRKSADVARARASMAVCLEAFEVCPVDRRALEAADALSGSDFEDNLQIACAKHAGLDAIVTRDPVGLGNPTIPVLAPAAILARLGAQP